jgi:hypothetical protein
VRQAAAPLRVPVPPDRHGVKITRVPAKPSSRPAARGAVITRSVRASNATTTVHSGVVALRMPARPESIVCSPTPNRKKGTTLPTVAATAKCAHTTGLRGSRNPRIQQISSRRPAARNNRRNTTCIGVNPRSPTLIHMKLDPQSRASRARRTTLPPCAMRLRIRPA